MDLVYRYFNRVIVMKDGNLSFDGDPEDLFKSDLLEENHLDLPNTIKTMKYINQELNLDLDIYKKTPEDVILELKKVMPNE
jgi:energy-coupling factor transport system ATP-binding protein